MSSFSSASKIPQIPVLVAVPHISESAMDRLWRSIISKEQLLWSF